MTAIVGFWGRLCECECEKTSYQIGMRLVISEQLRKTPRYLYAPPTTTTDKNVCFGCFFYDNRNLDLAYDSQDHDRHHITTQHGFACLTQPRKRGLPLHS